ncbi:hypothetical protein BD309DRAFT_727674 [Dichomitus squalens]|nr:hypothetical protein BD309DRAFT_727674 [Dichomitus squalens]
MTRARLVHLSSTVIVPCPRCLLLAACYLAVASSEHPATSKTFSAPPKDPDAHLAIFFCGEVSTADHSPRPSHAADECCSLPAIHPRLNISPILLPTPLVIPMTASYIFQASSINRSWRHKLAIGFQQAGEGIPTKCDGCP